MLEIFEEGKTVCKTQEDWDLILDIILRILIDKH